MADQEIKYKVTADTTQAKAAFKELNGEVDDLGGKANETATGGMDALDKAIYDYRHKGEKAKETTKELGGNISLMGGLFAGAATGGVYLLGNALYNFASDALSVDTSVTNLTKKIKEHWSELFKANQEWEKFNEEIKKFNASELIESVSALNRQLTEMGNKMLGGWTAPFFQLKELFSGGAYTKYMQNLLTQIQSINKELYGTPKALGWEDVPKDMQKAWKESFKNIQVAHKNHWERMSDIFRKGYNSDLYTGAFKFEDKESPFAKYFTGKQNVPKFDPLGGEDVEQTFLYENRMFLDATIAAANTLRSEFTSAWEDIFGEANSLFEKLMMNIVESIFTNLLTTGAGAFLNFIVPGLGTAAGLVMGPNSSQTQPIVLELDGRTMATWYVGGREQAGRLRM